MSKIKINEDKILQAVLSSEELKQEYKYNLDDYSSVNGAFYAAKEDEQPVVVAVATIIRDIKTGKAEKEVYKKIVNLFNKNLV